MSATPVLSLGSQLKAELDPLLALERVLRPAAPAKPTEELAT
jgi:hypothetical protein